MPVQSYLSGDTAVKISRGVEEALADGRAAAGDPLPPVRALATRLGVSPATAAAAYRLLRERGLAIADGRRGTRIRPAPPVAALTAAPLPAGVRDLSEGNPDPSLLPDVERVVRTLRVPPRVYGDELNDPGVLALAKEQFAADRVPAAHVAVVSGALDGIERVLREHLRPGDRVAVEDPCFPGLAELLAARPLIAVPVLVDDAAMPPGAPVAARRVAPVRV